jgi:hypothetical protein
MAPTFLKQATPLNAVERAGYVDIAGHMYCHRVLAGRL